MKNRNSNNNKFHQRCQHLLNYNLFLQTYNSFCGCELRFCTAQLVARPSASELYSHPWSRFLESSSTTNWLHSDQVTELIATSNSIMQYELWKRIWSYWTCSSYRVQGYSSKPDYSTVPQLGQATVLSTADRDRLHGVVSAALQATGLLWRWHPVSSETIPTCRWDHWDRTSPVSMDETLFERVLNDDRHVLHSLLPRRTECSYNLRRRRHDYKLIAKTRTLNINNFIMRMLRYIKTVTDTFIHFQIMRTCHLFY